LSAALLAIVVAAGEASTPGSAALLATASELLAPAASVKLVESSDPNEADGLRIERALGASAIAIVTWQEPAHLHALLRVHVARGNRWMARVLTFSPQDTTVERGRTLGLAATSMCPQIAPAAAEPAPTAAAPSAEPGQPAAAPTARPATITPVPAVASTRSTPSQPVVASRVRLGASAIAATGVGGPADGVGGALEGIVFPARTVGLRLGGGLRVGSIDALPGSHRVYAIAAGIEWWPIAEPRWGLGLAADALALRDQVTRDGVGQTQTLGRFVPGADVIASAAINLAPSWQVLLGLGAEIAFGETEVRDGSAHVVVATIPPLRAVARIGFRVGL